MKRTKRVTLSLVAALMTIGGLGCGGGGGSGAAELPSVSLVTPADFAAEVPINQKVAATFSKPMDPSTLNGETFSLVLNGEVNSAVAGSVLSTDVNAVFSPDADLVGGSSYTATITTGVKDLDGNALAVDYVWTFTTGTVPDVSPPEISFVDPADLATGVPLNKKVAVTFSEPLDPLSITGSSTYSLKQGETLVPGLVTYAGTVATFTPAANLAALTVYTATVTIAAKDLAGNPLAVERVWTFTTGTGVVALNPVALGQATGFAMLAGYEITNVPGSAITGDIGLSPSAESLISGFVLYKEGVNPYASSTQVVGNIYAADQASPIPSMLTTAKGDLTLAYNDAAGRSPTPVGTFLNPGSGNLAGLTLVPGLYKFTGAALATTNFTLSGSQNDVWIFQIASKLEIASYVEVILINGALAKNVFWQVGSSATLGTGCKFQGTVMADQSITLENGATLIGRTLAFTGTIALAQNVITLP